MSNRTSCTTCFRNKLLKTIWSISRTRILSLIQHPIISTRHMKLRLKSIICHLRAGNLLMQLARRVSSFISKFLSVAAALTSNYKFINSFISQTNCEIVQTPFKIFILVSDSKEIPPKRCKTIKCIFSWTPRTLVIH